MLGQTRPAKLAQKILCWRTMAEGQGWKDTGIGRKSGSLLWDLSVIHEKEISPQYPTHPIIYVLRLKFYRQKLLDLVQEKGSVPQQNYKYVLKSKLYLGCLPTSFLCLFPRYVLVSPSAVKSSRYPAASTSKYIILHYPLSTFSLLP